ncbi:MAG: dihydrolipoyl dehydrogenase [Anaerolineae bacterium]
MKSNVKDYDVVVIGSGSGMSIVDAALQEGLEVALVDKGPLGGTCSNVGCIPSKMLIAAADRVMEIREAQRIGVEGKVVGIDFRAIMERMRFERDEGQRQMREGIASVPSLGYYPVEAHFVADRTLQVGESRIRGKKVFIVAGARPLVPPIMGLDTVPYLDNASLLELDRPPESLIIIGGGYIACEYAHFIEAMGTRVTLVELLDRLVVSEEPEVSEILRREMAERMAVHLATEAIEVLPRGRGVVVLCRNRLTGERVEFVAEQVLVAVGRQSNADLLQVANTGVRTDVLGYVWTNEFLETSAANVWALGDITGKAMFRHTANRAAVLAWHNSQKDHRIAMEYGLVPHAIYAHPQIAAVGLTEEEARRNYRVLVGKASYNDVAQGLALKAKGMAKVIVDAESDQILGFHIVGPYAPLLIQEVVSIMALGGDAGSVGYGMHIHPALSEVVLAALGNVGAHEHEHVHA